MLARVCCAAATRRGTLLVGGDGDGAGSGGSSSGVVALVPAAATTETPIHRLEVAAAVAQVAGTGPCRLVANGAGDRVAMLSPGGLLVCTLSPPSPLSTVPTLR